MTEHVLPPLLTEERVRELRVIYSITEANAGNEGGAERARDITALCDAWLASRKPREGDWPWRPIDTIPAGRPAIVVQQLPENCWRYVFAEWRVLEDGREGLFDTECHEVVGASHWMPEPDWHPSRTGLVAASDAKETTL